MNTKNLTQSLFSLKNRTALVTGGGSGLGKIIAQTLAHFGANLILVSRHETNLLKTKEEILETNPFGSIKTIIGDLSTEEHIEKLILKINNDIDSLDILINNSGVSWGKELGKFPYKAWDRVFSVNVTGLFHFTQNLLPLLEVASKSNQPSKILNLGSVMGESPYGDGAYSYSASKASVHHLTKILAKELANRNITVNAFAPGPFASKMTDFAINSTKKLNSVAKGIPLGRIGRYEDIAAATIFICGPGGDYITGAVLPIDGGLHISTGPELFAESRLL